MTTRTAHLDTVIRMALGMMAADPASALPNNDRLWIANRLLLVDDDGQRPALTDEERAIVKPLLLTYLRAHRPSIWPIVAKQFDETNQENSIC